ALLHGMRSGSGETRTAEGIDDDSEPSGFGAGFAAMRGAEAFAFWSLYVAAILALIPQGLVSAGHVLAGSEVTSWLIPLHLSEQLQLPAAIGFLVFGTALAWIATRIYVRASQRRSEEPPDDRAGSIHG